MFNHWESRMAWPLNTYVTHSMQIMTSITTTLEMPHWELLNMPKQKLHIIMLAWDSLIKGYGMIFQIILNFVHLYLVLKMPCTSIWLLSYSFKIVFSWPHILPILNNMFLLILNVLNHVNMYILFDWCMSVVWMVWLLKIVL